MANGNDGHIFQHTFDLALAQALAKRSSSGGLHVVFTHAMSPFERCDEQSASHTKGLTVALDAIAEDPADDEPPLLAAYRAAETSMSHMPNSAELLATALGGRDKFTGVLAEIKRGKANKLRKAWNDNKSMMILEDTWRAGLRSELRPPEGLGRPWLISVDCTQFNAKANDPSQESDDLLYATDLARLRVLTKRYMDTGQPGALVIFSYTMRPKAQGIFREKLNRVMATPLSLHALDADAPGRAFGIAELKAPGGNRHLAFVAASSREIAAEVFAEWETLYAAVFEKPKPKRKTTKKKTTKKKTTKKKTSKKAAAAADPAPESDDAAAKSYYRTIDGIKYDRGMLDSADEAVAGKGDGRISLADAQKLIVTVTDGGKYTDVEKATMKYIRENYKFTDEADSWFRTEIRRHAASK